MKGESKTVLSAIK